MKKGLLFGLSICSLIALGTSLTSCGGSSTSSSEGTSSVVDNTDAILEAAINGLSVPEEVEDDFTLAVNAVGGAKISWESSNVDAISIDGSTATVHRSREGDIDVVLTAVAKLNNKESAPKEFKVKVLKQVVELPEGTITVKQAKESEVGVTVTVSGVVSAHVGGVYNSNYSANGFYLSDETETIYVYGYMVANTVERGDLICITATVAEYKGAIQLSSPTLVNDSVISKNNAIPDPSGYAVQGTTIPDLTPTTYADAAGKTFIFDCYIITYSGTNYTNYEVSTELSGGTYLNIYSSASELNCPENAWLDQYVEAKQQVKVAFYVNSTNSAGSKYRGNVVYVF